MSEEWIRPQGITPVDISFVSTVATDVDRYYIGLTLEWQHLDEDRIDELLSRIVQGQPLHVCLTYEEAVSVRDRLTQAMVGLRRLEDSGIPPSMMFPGDSDGH